MTADGSARPAGGTLAAYEPPSGHGVRVDGFGYAGYRTNPRFDSLLAKVIVHAPSDRLADAAAQGAIARCPSSASRGVPTTFRSCTPCCAHPDFVAGDVHTRFVEEHIAGALLAATPTHAAGFDAVRRSPRDAAGRRAGRHRRSAGRLVAWQASGDAEADDASRVDRRLSGPKAPSPLRAPMQGTDRQSSPVAPGDTVRAGQPVLVMEAMKMQHCDRGAKSAASCASSRSRRATRCSRAIAARLHRRSRSRRRDAVGRARTIDLDHIRPDLAEVSTAARCTTDEARPEAVARRRKTGQRTARENIDDLCDPGSFVEYGSLVVAARLRRSTMEELIERTPADGLVMGLGRVNGDQFPDEKSARVVDVLRLHGAGRHAGPQITRRRTACSSWREQMAAAGGVLHRRRRRRGPATPMRSARAAHTTTFHQFAQLSAWCRWSASIPAAASPATRCCWAAATSSSPRRIPPSAWAARR